MKANRTYRRMTDRAEVGVGTLIVFIAMVLVAAVAAAVLINTTGTLQQRAQSTGQEATQEVASNLKVISVYGVRNGTAAEKIHKIDLTLELAAGATSLDLTKLIVRYADGTSSHVYSYGFNGGSGFNTTWIRGANSSAVMKSGDLVQVQIHTWPATSAELDTRKSVEIALIPETGSPVQADFKTPATYGTASTITLR